MPVAQQFILDSDDAGVHNGFILNSDSAAGIALGFSAQQQQQSSVALLGVTASIATTSRQPQQSIVAIIGWAYVTLVAPIYTGPGSLAYNGQFVGGPPVAGDIVAYDPSLVTVYSNGTFSSTQYGSAQASYNDGTGWVPFTLTIAPWDVNPVQAQQAAVAFTVTPQLAFVARQSQQSSVDIAPISGLSINPVQAQQMSALVVVQAAPAFTAQQAQQALSMDARARVNPAINPRENQQSSTGIAVAAQLGFVAAQQQQSNTGVTVPSPIPIAIGPQQAQQGAATITTEALLGINVAQPQQAPSINVLVPPAVVISMTAQQGQQSAQSISTAQSITATSGQQGQQNVFQIQASMAARFTAQQQQQALIVIPNLPSPAIGFGPVQQKQQVSADIILFPTVAFTVAQAQFANFTIDQLPEQLIGLDPEGISFQFGNAYPTSPANNTKVFYIGRDNTATLGVLYYGEPLDLGPLTRIQVELIGTTTVIDSNGAPDWIDWTQGSNTITFKIGMVPGLVPGVYPIGLIIYDFAHPDGQTIAGPGLPLVLFDIEQDRSAVA